MKMFPILFDYHVREEIDAVRAKLGVSIVIALPWPMMMPHEKQAQRNHSQSLARLAERGGLSACEACAVLDDRGYGTMHAFDAHARLKELFEAWVRAGFPTPEKQPEAK